MTPCTVITSAEAVPAVPRAGCFAAVAAPAGRALEATTTAPVLTAVTFPFRVESVLSIEASDVFPVVWSALVAPPEGNGSDPIETGTTWSEAMFTAVELAMLWAPKATGSFALRAERVASRARPPVVPMFTVPATFRAFEESTVAIFPLTASVMIAWGV